MEFPVYDYAVDDALEHSEVCNEDSQPQTFIEYDSADIQGICKNDIDNEGTEFIQRIFAVVLGLSHKADIVGCREAAGIDIFLKFVQGENHEEQDHKSLKCRDGVGEYAECEG